MVRAGSSADDKLPASDRISQAEFSGVAGRYRTEADRYKPCDVAVAAVRAVITSGPAGFQVGVAPADPHGITTSTVELLEATGADIMVAEQHAAETRFRFGRTGVRFDIGDSQRPSSSRSRPGGQRCPGQRFCPPAV
ncbi:hypothetical protein ACIBBG_33680 [Micromonospora chersina]|uniref:hypothetical protein n=1 Tax=Micromonospora chersina TaxID=47854 RepID=UPI0037B12961